MSEITTFYLVRHAQAQGNVDKFFQGRYDGQISALGKQQIAQLRTRAVKLRPDVLVSSPLSRAVETAKALQQPGQVLHCDDRLLEIDGGSWEGQPWGSFARTDPVRAKQWEETPWEFCAPEGEPMCEVFARAKEAITFYHQLHKGKRIALVSHGCWIRNAMTWLKGYDITQMDQVPFCDNTSVTCVTIEEQNTVHILWENDTSHLSAQCRVSVKELFADGKEKEQ